jgi:S1-C subfamily serine protease
LLRLLAAIAAVGAVASAGAIAFAWHLEQRTTQLEDDLAEASREVDSLEERLQSAIGRIEREQARKLDPGAIFDRVKTRVVTVYCGASQGSGWIKAANPAEERWKSVVVTNHHVIEDCTFGGRREAVEVVSGDRTMEGFVDDWDADRDLGLILLRVRIEPLEDAPPPKIGAPVVAIGSPWGLSGTVTQGIITNRERSALLTDAALNPGSSGGPLFDAEGRVLGTVVAKIGEGTGFVIPLPELCDSVLNCDTDDPIRWRGWP